ncbi:hypothetical protein [Lentzea sp. HUAS12]|uniref:hypothetical protein n=1 Tax=Lentzea sp. HUAS12 TaxID=2951806 RepID=UPI00209FE119|nr:hypothetical protein [Lentzea sp. HUAS12]USX56362.1 hypothetical protein ND450_20345 [Lentzea sp. HUAS12]
MNTSLRQKGSVAFVLLAIVASLFGTAGTSVAEGYPTTPSGSVFFAVKPGKTSATITVDFTVSPRLYKAEILVNGGVKSIITGACEAPAPFCNYSRTVATFSSVPIDSLEFRLYATNGTISNSRIVQ